MTSADIAYRPNFSNHMTDVTQCKNVVKASVAHVFFKLVVEDICGTLLRAPGHSCNRPLRKWTMLDMLVLTESTQHREECSTQCFAPSPVLMRAKWMFCHAMSGCWCCLFVGLDCGWKNLCLNQCSMEHQFGHAKFPELPLGSLKSMCWVASASSKKVKLYAMSQPSLLFSVAVCPHKPPGPTFYIFMAIGRNVSVSKTRKEKMHMGKGHEPFHEYSRWKKMETPVKPWPFHFEKIGTNLARLDGYRKKDL